MSNKIGIFFAIHPRVADDVYERVVVLYEQIKINMYTANESCAIVVPKRCRLAVPFLNRGFLHKESFHSISVNSLTFASILPRKKTKSHATHKHVKRKKRKTSRTSDVNSFPKYSNRKLLRAVANQSAYRRFCRIDCIAIETPYVLVVTP